MVKTANLSVKRNLGSLAGLTAELPVVIGLLILPIIRAAK
jgi:hypothetical protein